MADYEIFALGNVVLQAGLTLRSAQLAYKTYGTLNSRKDNAIVYPTFYGGQHPQNEPMIGPGLALDHGLPGTARPPARSGAGSLCRRFSNPFRTY